MAFVENSAVEVAADAGAESSQRLDIDLNHPPAAPMDETNDSGVQIGNGWIYDSENAKNCHQCRQKTRNFSALCKKLKNEKPCPLIFCHKCLLNRYGEKVDEVGKLEIWICPKCRDVCNCSMCMKRKGYQPTGILSHTAKANGFNSVHELLHNKGAEVLEPWRAESNASSRKYLLPNKASPALKRSLDMKSQCVEQKGTELNEEGSTKKAKKKGAKRLKFIGTSEREVHAETNGGNVIGSASAEQKYENAYQLETQVYKIRKSKKLAIRIHTESASECIVPPQGALLTEVAGTELPVHDVGAALQFLEFCNSFSEVLDIKKGQPECLLQDLIRGCICKEAHSAHVDLNIKLLSLIEKDLERDGDAWLQTLKRRIKESKCIMEELPLDFLDKGLAGYDDLEPSKKLKILNFLCDEVLSTEAMRKWIEDATSKFDEEMKEKIEKVLLAKKKEKLLKQQTKDEKAKALLPTIEETPLVLTQADDLLSELRAEADKAHAEVLASLELVPKRNQRSDAVRTDRVILGSNGHSFWRLSGYNNRSNIALQDIGSWDSVTPSDKWFIYNEEEEKVVEKYISSLRNPKRTSRKSDDVEEETKPDLTDCPGSQHCLPQVEEQGEGSHVSFQEDEEIPAVSCDILPQVPSEQ